MSIAQKAMRKIYEYKTSVLSGYPESVSGYDAFLWLSGYLAALRENNLIDEPEFIKLRDELREIPIHSSSPIAKNSLTK